jgi:hypothetical protein
MDVRYLMTVFVEKKDYLIGEIKKMRDYYNKRLIITVL